jgi:phage gp29-like protein
MFCDKFAGPTVTGEYPSGALKEQQDALLAAAQAVHTNSAVIYPQGMKLDLLEAARSGSITTYKELVEYMDGAMTVVILGQTATTEGTPGALGNQDAQADVRGDLVKADADALCEALNSENGVVRWLVDYQFPGTRNYPQIWIKCEDEEDELTVAERDEKRSSAVAAAGARLTPMYFKRRYALEDDEIEEAGPRFEDRGSRENRSIQLAEGDEPTATVSALSERLGTVAGPETDAWVDTLRKKIDAAEGMEELPEIILAAYPDMSMEGLAGIIAEETMRAFMAGRFDAESGE